MCRHNLFPRISQLQCCTHGIAYLVFSLVGWFVVRHEFLQPLIQTLNLLNEASVLIFLSCDLQEWLYFCKQSPPWPIPQFQIASDVALEHTDGSWLFQQLLVPPACSAKIAGKTNMTIYSDIWQIVGTLTNPQKVFLKSTWGSVVHTFSTNTLFPIPHVYKWIT